jgi:hypothetical protein
MFYSHADLIIEPLTMLITLLTLYRFFRCRVIVPCILLILWDFYLENDRSVLFPKI